MYGRPKRAVAAGSGGEGMVAGCGREVNAVGWAFWPYCCGKGAVEAGIRRGLANGTLIRSGVFKSNSTWLRAHSTGFGDRISREDCSIAYAGNLCRWLRFVDDYSRVRRMRRECFFQTERCASTTGLIIYLIILANSHSAEFVW